MHAVYGAHAGGAHDANGQWFDTVIPGYLERELFPFSQTKSDYYLFMGRLIERKGAHVAAEVCKAAGKRLLIAGQGDEAAALMANMSGSSSPRSRQM